MCTIFKLKIFFNSCREFEFLNLWRLSFCEKSDEFWIFLSFFRSEFWKNVEKISLTYLLFSEEVFIRIVSESDWQAALELAFVWEVVSSLLNKPYEWKHTSANMLHRTVKTPSVRWSCRPKVPPLVSNWAKKDSCNGEVSRSLGSHHSFNRVYVHKNHCGLLQHRSKHI